MYIAKLLTGKKIYKHSFEEVGNYIYSISRREIEKVALGSNFKIVCYKGTNDFHIKGAENEKLAENGPIQKKIKRRLS